MGCSVHLYSSPCSQVASALQMEVKLKSVAAMGKGAMNIRNIESMLVAVEKQQKTTMLGMGKWTPQNLTLKLKFKYSEKALFSKNHLFGFDRLELPLHLKIGVSSMFVST